MRAHDGLSCASVTDGLRYNIGAVWFFLQKRDMEHGQYVLAAKVSENERNPQHAYHCISTQKTPYQQHISRADRTTLLAYLTGASATYPKLELTVVAAPAPAPVPEKPAEKPAKRPAEESTETLPKRAKRVCICIYTCVLGKMISTIRSFRH